ncbi:flagellar FlbD family protein [Caryophanon tenue]|uniref:Flagellar protein FlbD n=1 Tax=Caryophanon tenue TaxID=33978 RepID=A0A1C0YKL0_9BACL|nr:flagellar FlbD family protein [Caryophanon tenue]OCS87681.1 hypothetical protein A6M13_10280 [Caryophanon tenue]
MIELQKLNGKPFTLNAIYIETIEANPDTTIMLTNKTKYIVLNSVEDVRRQVTQFYLNVQILSNPHLRGDEDEEE